jgi:hypothetical protein
MHIEEVSHIHHVHQCQYMSLPASVTDPRWFFADPDPDIRKMLRIF